MAAKTNDKPVNEEVIITDPTTVVVAKKPEPYRGPTVSVFLPRLEEEGNGIRVDQYEHVTISNETQEKRWFIKRGEHVDIPVAVYAILKAKYPDI